MVKLLLTFLISIVPLAAAPANENYEQFMNEVDAGYEYYECIENTNNDSYSITIIKGIYNGYPCYGINFTSIEENKYHLSIYIDGGYYRLEKSGRSESGLAIIASSKIYVDLVNKDNNKMNLSELNIFTTTQFEIEMEENENKIITGQGKGRTFTNLTYEPQSYDFTKKFITVLLIIIGSTLSLLLILFIFKKGLFNKAKRSENIINMRNVLFEETKDNPNNDYIQEVPIPEEKTETIADVKAYLLEKGFITNYNILSEEEKNRIMIELIKLKNEKKITEDKYYEETYELWKK